MAAADATSGQQQQTMRKQQAMRKQQVMQLETVTTARKSCSARRRRMRTLPWRMMRTGPSSMMTVRASLAPAASQMHSIEHMLELCSQLHHNVSNWLQHMWAQPHLCCQVWCMPLANIGYSLCSTPRSTHVAPSNLFIRPVGASYLHATSPAHPCYLPLPLPCPSPLAPPSTPCTQPDPRTLLHAAPAGVAPASDGEDDDDIAAGEQRHLEAEEGEMDDIDMLIKQRKRRRGPDDQQITQMVTSMVARMEFAAEEDTKAQSSGAWRCLLPGLL